MRDDGYLVTLVYTDSLEDGVKEGRCQNTF